MKSRCNRKVDIYVCHYFLCSLPVLVVVVAVIHINILVSSWFCCCCCCCCCCCWALIYTMLFAPSYCV